MATKRKPKSIAKNVLVVVASFLLLSLIGFVGYFIYSYYNSIRADEELLSQAKDSDKYGYQENKDNISLIPAKPNGTGVIVYPGAFAEPEGYVAVFKTLAENGVGIFVVKSPLNFALLDVGSATKIIKNNPQISKWYVAGHSLGGVAACEYAKSHQSEINGLILLGSYCNGDAKNLNLPVLSISASKDGLTDTTDVANSRDKLPINTEFIVVEGGNHTQFGAFQKLQPGDNPAQTSQSEQTKQIADAIARFIK